MSLLSKLLARLQPAPRRPVHIGDALSEAKISQVIQDAFAAVGLAETAPTPAPSSSSPLPSPPLIRRRRRAAIPLPRQSPGAFLEGSFSHQARTLRYRLYIPPAQALNSTQRPALVVMLHGCTQSPEDFALGTRMNLLADRHGFLVAYPAQSPLTNGSKCWNWFRPQDQVRDSGEPALLAGLTRELIARHEIDPQRVYVAGLSAGAAMAVILATTYPDVYAAVGAHSGLPYRAARGVPSALAAMGGTHALREVESSVPEKILDLAKVSVMPLIVFHGDADQTVAPVNGEALVKQALGPASGLLPENQITDKVGGRAYSHSIYTTTLGEPLVEYWQIHGAGHAWSGGDSSGSYTDAEGPDASAEMIRFFFQLRPGNQGLL